MLKHQVSTRTLYFSIKESPKEFFRHAELTGDKNGEKMETSKFRHFAALTIVRKIQFIRGVPIKSACPKTYSGTTFVPPKGPEKTRFFGLQTITQTKAANRINMPKVALRPFLGVPRNQGQRNNSKKMKLGLRLNTNPNFIFCRLFL